MRKTMPVVSVFDKPNGANATIIPERKLGIAHMQMYSPIILIKTFASCFDFISSKLNPPRPKIKATNQRFLQCSKRGLPFNFLDGTSISHINCAVLQKL